MFLDGDCATLVRIPNGWAFQISPLRLREQSPHGSGHRGLFFASFTLTVYMAAVWRVLGAVTLLSCVVISCNGVGHGAPWIRERTLIRDSPDESQTGINVRVSPALL